MSDYERGKLAALAPHPVDVPRVAAAVRAHLAAPVRAHGHRRRWRHDEIGQAGLGLPESATELVLATGLGYEPDWLVTSADEAARSIQSAGGQVIAAPFDIPVGRLARVADPFGNILVVLDLSRGQYRTDGARRVIGLSREDG